MADRPVLAGLDFVLKYDLQKGPIVAEAIRRADQTDDLVAFHHARARIGREGSDRRDVVHIHAADGAVLIYGDACFDAVFAGMDIGNEGLHPVGDELNGTAKHDAQSDDCHIFVIDMELHSERAADVRCHDPDTPFPYAIMAAVKVLELVGCLRSVMNGEPLFARIVVRDDCARFQGYRRVAPKQIGLLDHGRGGLERLIDAAGLDFGLKGDVAAELGVDERTAGLASGIDICDRFEFLELDGNKLGGIFGLRARFSDDRHHRLSGPEHLAQRQRQLRRRFHAAEMIEGADPGLA